MTALAWDAFGIIVALLLIIALLPDFETFEDE
jgi:hypothetical protein